jgi:hypothetical protein
MAAQAIAMQRMQQQREQEEEAQKRYKQQLGMQQQQLGLQEKRLGIAQAQEDRIAEKQAADEWLFLQADEFVGKDLDQIDEQEFLRQLAQKAKDQGIKISHSQVWDFRERWLPSPTGDKQYYLDPNTGTIKVREKIKRGNKTYWTKGEDIEGIPAEVLQLAENNPGMISAMADTLEQTLGKDHKMVRFFRDWAAHEKAPSGSREESRVNRINKIFDTQVAKLNVKFFGTEKDPAPDQMPTGDQTLEDYQYEYGQLAAARDWKLDARNKGPYRPPKVPPSVKKYQKEVLGRDVTDKMWRMMTPEQREAAIAIAEANMGSKETKLPSRKGAAARNIKETFGKPAPGLLNPTGQMAGPPMTTEQARRMMQGRGL